MIVPLCYSFKTSPHPKGTFQKSVLLHGNVFCQDAIVIFAQKSLISYKVQAAVKNTSHPLHGAVTAQRSTFSNRLLPSWCTRKRFCRSFLPAAIRVQNWVGSLASASLYQLSFFQSHFFRLHWLMQKLLYVLHRFWSDHLVFILIIFIDFCQVTETPGNQYSVFFKIHISLVKQIFLCQENPEFA